MSHGAVALYRGDIRHKWPLSYLFRGETARAMGIRTVISEGLRVSMCVFCRRVYIYAPLIDAFCSSRCGCAREFLAA